MQLLQELHLENQKLIKHGYVEEIEDLDLRIETSAFAKEDDSHNEKGIISYITEQVCVCLSVRPFEKLNVTDVAS